MILGAVVCFAVAVLLCVFAVAICRGNTNLIHDYHRERVKESERRAYGRAFSKGLFVMSGSVAAAGGIFLLGESVGVVAALLGVLAVGFTVGSVLLVRAQRKYNGGMF